MGNRATIREESRQGRLTSVGCQVPALFPLVPQDSRESCRPYTALAGGLAVQECFEQTQASALEQRANQADFAVIAL